MTKHIIPRSKTNNLQAYVNSLINQPWTKEARHCWRFVREAAKELYGIDVPLVLEVAPGGFEGRKSKRKLWKEHPERANFDEIANPVDGAIVLMRRPFVLPGNFDHAGLYIDVDGGGILHCDAPQGVCFDSLREIELRRWVPSYFVRKQP